MIEKISFKGKRAYLSELMEDESLTYTDAPTLKYLYSQHEPCRNWATAQFAVAAGCAVGLSILDNQGVESKFVIVPLMGVFAAAFAGGIKDFKQMILARIEINSTYQAETINAAELARRVNKASYSENDLIP